MENLNLDFVCGYKHSRSEWTVCLEIKGTKWSVQRFTYKINNGFSILISNLLTSYDSSSYEIVLINNKDKSIIKTKDQTDTQRALLLVNIPNCFKALNDKVIKSLRDIEAVKNKAGLSCWE